MGRPLKKGGLPHRKKHKNQWWSPPPPVAPFERFELRYLFRKGLLDNGQLQLSKIPAGKNPADVLTKRLPASNLHKLLPKLGVRTRAVDSKDLLSVVNLEMLASPRREQSSSFIGMMAKHPVTAQLVASSVASRPLPSNSSHQHSQEAIPNLQYSQRPFSLSSMWRYFFFMVALLCAANSVFHTVISSMYGLFLSVMFVLMKLYWFIVSVYHQLLLHGHLCGELWEPLLL